MTSSLQVSDDAAAAIAVAPRATLADIETKIGFKAFNTADCILADGYVPEREIPPGTIGTLSIMTICILVMKNGFVVVGKSAPASPANFNRALGQKLAYEDAIRQLWPLEGYALRERLAAA